VLVHSHIQWRVKPNGKTARSDVELMRRDAEVAQQSINGSHAFQPQEVPDMPKVFWDKFEPLVIQYVGVRIGVLIESE